MVFGLAATRRNGNFLVAGFSAETTPVIPRVCHSARSCSCFWARSALVMMTTVRAGNRLGVFFERTAGQTRGRRPSRRKMRF